MLAEGSYCLLCSFSYRGFSFKKTSSRLVSTGRETLTFCLNWNLGAYILRTGAIAYNMVVRAIWSLVCSFQVAVKAVVTCYLERLYDG